MIASRTWIWLLMGLLAAGFAAWWVRVPGYMDADYYYANARQIVEGEGLQEPFLWNYLDDPQGLPHPSFTYWMPLASLVASISMIIAGAGFRAAQAPFILITACLPVLTAHLAGRLTTDGKTIWQAALLAMLPGFFFPFLVTTDTFALFALVGGGAMAAMASAVERGRPLRWLVAGVLTGLAHLARADGVLLLAPGLLAAVFWSGERRRSSGFLLLAGYFAVMTPWWARGALAGDSLLPLGLSRTLWLLRYDDLFSFPASILTPERWWAAGLTAIGRDRLQALLTNLQSLIAVNGLIFLGPFMIVAAIENRREPIVRLSGVYLALLIGVMSFVFPYAGSRGGFFHSSSALMPVLWALAPLGLRRTVRWAAELRGWVVERAQTLYGWTAPALAGALTFGLLWSRVIGGTPSEPAWGGSAAAYVALAAELDSLDPSRPAVAVNNPPGFFLASRSPSVMIPNGPPEALRAATARFNIMWVILDANRPEGLAGLYETPSSEAWLHLAWRVQEPRGEDILLLRVLPEGVEP